MTREHMKFKIRRDRSECFLLLTAMPDMCAICTLSRPDRSLKVHLFTFWRSYNRRPVDQTYRVRVGVAIGSGNTNVDHCLCMYSDTVDGSGGRPSLVAPIHL